MVSSLLRLSHLGAVLTLAAVLGLCGCSSPEDERFRVAVGPVLKQCAELSLQLGRSRGEVSFNEAERIKAVIGRLQAALVALPAPKGKPLRYLSIRLSVLSGGATDIVASWYQTDYELRESCKKYAAAMAYLGATERVALGTSTMRDALEAWSIRSDGEGLSHAQRDSAYTETERIVRSEIAAMR